MECEACRKADTATMRKEIEALEQRVTRAEMLRAELAASEALVSALQEQMARMAEQHTECVKRLVAEAREEQREQDARTILAGYSTSTQRQKLAQMIRHTPLEATPLADRIEALEAEQLRSDKAAIRFACESSGALAKETAAHQETKRLVEALASEFEAVLAEADRPKGGMSVPFRGDFAGALRVPSMLGRIRWWARELRASLPAQEKR